MRVCIDTLGKKLLPNTLRLAQECGGDRMNIGYEECLTIEPWRCREKMVNYLEKVLDEFEDAH